MSVSRFVDEDRQLEKYHYSRCLGENMSKQYIDGKNYSDGHDQLFVRLPRLASHDGLTPYEYRLLSHYIELIVTNGYSVVMEGTRKTAEACGMSHTSIKNCRKSLKEKGWIETMKVGNRKTIRVKVLARAGDNIRMFSPDGNKLETTFPDSRQTGNYVSKLETTFPQSGNVTPPNTLSTLSLSN